MRTTACPISLWLPWVLLTLPSLSCCDRATALRYADGDPAGRQTITVAALKERCHGPSVRIAEELNIRDGCCFGPVLIMNGEITPGDVFDLTLPLERAAEGYQAMDERRAVKVLLTP